MATSAAPTAGNALIRFLHRCMASSSAPRVTTVRSMSKAESATGLRGTSGLSSTTTLDSDTSSAASTLVPPLGKPCPGLLPAWEAELAIREFIDRHWSHRADYIRIDCRLTLPELRALGRLSREEGALACRRLVRVPAIHEEVALSLWEHLAREAEEGGEKKVVEEEEDEEQEAAGDANPTTATVASLLRPPRADHQPVVPANNDHNNSDHEAEEEPRTRRLRSQLKSLVTSLLSPGTHIPPRPHTTTPALNRKAAGNLLSCPFCSGDCTASLSAAAQEQQQQQTYELAFWRWWWWRRRRQGNVSVASPTPSRRLSGDTLTASRTGGSAGYAGPSVVEKGGVSTRRFRFFPLTSRLRLLEGPQQMERRRGSCCG
ncbi:hypothetical protein VTH06DRAFT_7881 [Thermothelomyces fergusii]